MDHRTVFAPARPGAGALAAALATTMTAVLAASVVLAQTPPAPKAQPKATPKAAPKAAPAPAPAEQPPQAQAGEQPQLIFSPWTKFCLKGQETGAKQVCFTGKDGRVESGQPVVAAGLIEAENAPKKIRPVTLPLGLA